jgi:hypothetical protein
MSPRYPLNRTLGGPQSRSERYEEVKILAPPGFEIRPLGRPVRLYQLRHPGPVLVILFILVYVNFVSCKVHCVDGGIFENVLYWINCTNFLT